MTQAKDEKIRKAYAESAPYRDELVFTDLRAHLIKARRKHPETYSLHHMMSVIREEYIELETEVYKQEQDKTRIREEALHLAATALRLVIERL